ncbi:hypothetical protein ACIRPT_16125 [Streptomyces sp. NPDC101227]|uniref:hypothetical protein n=1 Tax=Streptomyces sp. NPDC101227 TaxID=3366136 RepID=UPI00380D1387
MPPLQVPGAVVAVAVAVAVVAVVALAVVAVAVVVVVAPTALVNPRVNGQDAALVVVRRTTDGIADEDEPPGRPARAGIHTQPRLLAACEGGGPYAAAADGGVEHATE